MGQRYCDHTFVCIRDYTEVVDQKGLVVFPAVVVCMYCGQVRQVDVIGNVTIAVEEGKIIKKKNEQPNDTTQKV